MRLSRRCSDPELMRFDLPGLGRVQGERPCAERYETSQDRVICKSRRYWRKPTLNAAVQPVDSTVCTWGRWAFLVNVPSAAIVKLA